MFRKITLFALILALIVIVFSSTVRLSDAAIGCPDWSGWPGCYGDAGVAGTAPQSSLIPIEVKQVIKDWVNYRSVIAVIGILVLFLTVSAWTQKLCRLAAVVSSNALLTLLGLQLLLGVWAVKIKMMPVIVTGQLLLGFITFWLLFWMYLRTNPKVELNQQTVKTGPRLLARVAMLGLLLQIILGFWTSTNQAGLACADFPVCNGVWVPAVDYLSALNLFAGLDSGYTGVLSFEGQVAAHWMHRAGALFCFMLLTWVMLRATSEEYPKPVRKAGLQLSALLLIELLLGIFSVKLELPLAMLVAHNVVAALLMLPLISISFYSKYGFVVGVSADEAVAVIEAVKEVELEAEEVYVEPSSESLYLRLTTQLKKTRTGLGGVLSSIPLGQKEINQDLLEEIESSLLVADLGIETTTLIISQLTARLERHQLNDGEALEEALKQILLEILQPCDQPLKIPDQDQPFVILVVGINGVGKTTTIGKLAKRLKLQGHSVMLAAGDTFRAAAVEQLEVWGERNEIHVVAQHTGADSASVIYDAVQSAQAKGIDVLIADTAGRLHTKSNLMDELSKIKRIMGKVDETAPHEVLLVLDAGTGQNALSQTKIFNEVVELSGLALTKLDGTAKGGVLFALANQFELPIRFIGVGEGIDDLQDFDAHAFVDALFVRD
ncbi:MAG: signal recognition particle-docking protein FtsY [Methylomarinum sp.]|nr:signal recognition particle-docking protein FtsY [Methylomarinum sp.]